MKPLCIDLFCGLGGWTEGFLAEGYEVVGFDIERHVYSDQAYPAQLVLQDVLTIHGSQFRNATVIVASPPCQKYSWLAMPWSRSKSDHSKAAKALRKEWETNGPDNRLFDACFRIQREACEAAGHYIPLIVENVRGCQEWTRRADWSYGSFYLWGDIPALMPINLKRAMKFNPDGTNHGTGSWFAIADSKNRGLSESGTKNTGGSWFNIGSPGQTVTNQNPVHELTGQKTAGGSWFRERNGIPQPGIRHEDRGVKVESLDGGRRTDIGKGARFTSRDCGVESGLKIGGDWFSDPNSTCRKHGSRSKARKAASAQIAKIPLPLSRHIAIVYYPRDRERVA